MDVKKILAGTVIGFLSVSLFCAYSAAENMMPNDQAVFEKLLDALLAKKNQETATNLLNFANTYPNSKFADDAYVVIHFTAFIGSLAGDNREQILRYITGMESFAARYPDGQLEELTYQKISKVTPGSENTGFDAIKLPYSYLAPYMRGMAATKFKEWQSVIDSFSVLKDKLGYNDLYAGAFQYDVYPCLAMAYMRLGKAAYADSIADEAVARFPQNKWLVEYMTKVRDAARKKMAKFGGDAG